MYNIIVIIIIILALFVIIDIPMITVINKSMYMDAFEKVNNGGINTGVDGTIAAILCYLLLTFAIYFFIVQPSLDSNKDFKTDFVNIFIKGFLLGLVIYGVYNTTNKATINNYSTKVTIVDTMWGSVLLGGVSVLSLYLIKLLKLNKNN